MVIKNKIIILIILFLSVACGKSNQENNTPVFLSRQVQSGMPLVYSEKYELISNLKRHQLIFDTDGDGIADKDDLDIDNDGIPNDCDSAPFNKKAGTLDSDKDKIPDFCDLNIQSDKIKDSGKALFQTSTFKKSGVIIFEDDLKFSENDIPFLTDLIDHTGTLAEMPNKKLYTLAVTTNLALGEYGSYDSNWSSIRFKQDKSQMSASVKLWQWALTHELFHFIAAANPDYYSSFQERYNQDLKDGSLVYPTEYSKESPEEYFAEFETTHYFELIN